MIYRVLRSAACAALLVALPAAADEFRRFQGHGGPIMDVHLSAGGTRLFTASFDNAVGIWSAEEASLPQWLDGHSAAVNCVIALPGGRAASGSDDQTVIIWDTATGGVLHRLTGHRGKVMALATTSDGGLLASAAWDGTIRVWDTGTGALVSEITGHKGNVNDVVFSGEGTHLISASHDGTVVEWRVADGVAVRTLAEHGFGVNQVVLNEADGWLAYGALDGGTRVLDLASGELVADLTAGRRPILAMAASDDGSRLAVGDGEGHIMVVETGTWRIVRDFRAALNGPIWALDFTASGGGVIAGGIADEAMLWPLDGTDSAPRLAELRREFHTSPDSVSNGERQFLRKCSVCHTLGKDGERRAGPPLAGLFGRPAAAIDGYPYSEAIRAMDLVWTAETIDALFDEGPENYIPGTKMPMQRIAKAEDRADLIDFLKRETGQE